MSRIKVTCEVSTYDTPAKPSIRVHSSWWSNDRVEIEVGDERYTVVAKDILAAIMNCTNTN